MFYSLLFVYPFTLFSLLVLYNTTANVPNTIKKVNGVPLYKLARKGQEVVREPRFINISKFELLSWESPKGRFVLSCSKGTYVRTVCNDLGKRIGCGAHMTALRRISSNKFDVANAVSLEELAQMTPVAIKKTLIPVREAVPSFAL